MQGKPCMKLQNENRVKEKEPITDDVMGEVVPAKGIKQGVSELLGT